MGLGSPRRCRGDEFPSCGCSASLNSSEFRSAAPSGNGASSATFLAVENDSQSLRLRVRAGCWQHSPPIGMLVNMLPRCGTHPLDRNRVKFLTYHDFIELLGVAG